MPVAVNGRRISDREINVESAHHGGSIARRRSRAAVSLAIRELLCQRAEELGVQTRSGGAQAIDAPIDALLEREVQVPALDEDACRRYFDANRDAFRTPDRAEVRHILLAAAPDDPPARERARRQAEALIAQLRSAPERFALLAAQHSACPSRDQGGSLGCIGRGQTVPEFESVVLRLPAGLSPRPLETRYGYHVVLIDAHLPGQPLPYAQVRERIADYLMEQGWRQAVSQYLQWLSSRARIEGIDLKRSDIHAAVSCG
ncbi:MAG: peptidyl-prolyl cis-trans isomerase [Gammaproteobacteria bacterium]|nr:peptidyl-prolyl cis-trans isomerase [Gammaproteobacteria bacterium]